MSDTTIPKQTKKMLLFTSPSNRILQLLCGKTEPSQTEIAKRLGIATSAISNWKNGTAVAEAAASGILTRIREAAAEHGDPETRKTIEDTLVAFEINYHAHTSHVYDTASILGIDRDECQKLLDEVYYKRAPIFPRMYLSNLDTATEYFAEYRGTYKVYVKRGTTWLVCPMRVRYVINVSGGYLLRCKLNLPIIHPADEMAYFEYDGYLVRKANRIFWMFEKRQISRNDYFHFMTDIGRAHRDLSNPKLVKRTMSGLYLTAGQDEFQTIVSEVIVIQKHDLEPSETVDNFMHTTAIAAGDDPARSEIDHFVRGLQETLKSR